MIDDHTSSVSIPFAASSICRCRLRTVKLPDSVFCRNTFAAIGSIPGDEFPAMIEIDAVGAIDILCENRSMMPYSAASGHGPRSSASTREARSACSRMCLNIRLFQTFAITLSHGTFCDCRKRVEPHHPEPDRALAHRGIARLLHPRRRAVDEVLQHVVEEPHHVLDERRMVLPLEPALQVQRHRQHTAVRSMPCWSRPVGSVISEHRLEVFTSSPASL